MRGATSCRWWQRYQYFYFNPRSSCEERPIMPEILSITSLFQSTLLMRGATQGFFSVVSLYCISIHAPHARSDSTMSAADKATHISIHAPHARSDRTKRGSSRYLPHFNPRSSCEERQMPVVAYVPQPIFQSTLLMRGATRFGIARSVGCLSFQSTLLMRGATSPWVTVADRAAKFQSTLLMRGATRQVLVPDSDGQISIHAPHARSDLHECPVQ